MTLIYTPEKNLISVCFFFFFGTNLTFVVEKKPHAQVARRGGGEVDPNWDDQLSTGRQLDIEAHRFATATQRPAAIAEEHCVGVRAAHAHVLQPHPVAAVAQA